MNQGTLDVIQTCEAVIDIDDNDSDGLVELRLNGKMCILPECVLMSAGSLCAGMGGKKKKKMMYLTTKNAGL